MLIYRYKQRFKERTNEQEKRSSQKKWQEGQTTKAEQKEETYKNLGGGWYELSNGQKVQGEDKAKKEQKKLGD